MFEHLLTPEEIRGVKDEVATHKLSEDNAEALEISMLLSLVKKKDPDAYKSLIDRM